MREIINLSLIAFLTFSSLESCLDECKECYELGCSSTLALCPTVYSKEKDGSIISTGGGCNSTECFYGGNNCTETEDK